MSKIIDPVFTYDLVANPGVKGAQLVDDYMFEKLRKEALRKLRREKIEQIEKKYE